MDEEKKGLFARLKEGLSKTRDNIVRGIDNVFSGFSSIDDDFYEELEEILVMGDIGVNATTQIIDRLKQQVKEQHIKEPADCKAVLMESIKEQMQVGENAYDFEREQSVVMVIGVNGVGKTTSIGKLAGKYKAQGRKVLIAAADTFRAAAGDQLAEWAKRADVPMIGGKEGADPASVVFDAVSAAKARGVDMLLIDTAGRLHNKKNLMEELRKMNRIIDREYPDAHRENFIVLDGTTGQNALVQAKEFGDVASLSGIILTKMDGTAKGGIAVAIQSELHVPVKYIGVGEKIEDLQRFDPSDFVDALFDVEPETGDMDGTEETGYTPVGNVDIAQNTEIAGSAEIEAAEITAAEITAAEITEAVENANAAEVTDAAEFSELKENAEFRKTADIGEMAENTATAECGEKSETETIENGTETENTETEEETETAPVKKRWWPFGRK